MTSTLPVRVARQHTARRVARLYMAQLDGHDEKTIAAVIASRYMSAVGRSPKHQHKRRYELAKHLLGHAQNSIQAWLVVPKTFPGWRQEMVDDPGGDRWQVVLKVTAPNGKSMLVYPKIFSKEHTADFDAWMRKETGVLEELKQLVENYEQAPKEEAPAKSQRSRSDLGVPIEKADFSPGKGRKTQRGEVYQIDFGIVDERGRAVGCSVVIFEPGVASQGEQWVCRVHPTRNGDTFGAIRAEKSFDTRREVEAAARKSMMASFKRYSKLYPKK